MRSTTPYCQPAVAACAALLTVPSRSHLLTRRYSKMRTKGNLKEDTRLCVSQRGLGLPRMSLVPPFFLSLFFKSGPQPPAGLLSGREKTGGVKGRSKREGQWGHVSEWRKITMHHVVKHRQRVEQKAPTMPIIEPVPAKKIPYLVNYTTSGPYGRASQQDRWTEYHNKKLSRASQLPDGPWTDKCRLMMCQIR